MYVKLKILQNSNENEKLVEISHGILLNAMADFNTMNGDYVLYAIVGHIFRIILF